MDFLRQPRREPQKPPSRKREADKKRSDREQEEVSAFFLQNIVPMNSNTRDRRKPTTAWPLNARGATADTSSHVSGPWRPSSQPQIAVENDPHPVTAHERSEGSKATTYLTWTASRRSSISRARLTSKSPKERNSIRSPSPLDVREALAETGVFHNTGIRCVVPNGEGDKNCVQDEPIMSRHSRRSPRFHFSRPRHDEPIRIIWYQDRGTMITQEDTPHTSPGKQIRTTPVRASAVTAQDRIRGASETPTTVQASSKTALASGVPAHPLCRTGVAHIIPGSKQLTDEPITINGNPKERDVQPERPISPKISVVERLEAAANNQRQSPMECGTTPNARYGGWYPGHAVGDFPSVPTSHEGADQWPTRTASSSMIRARDVPTVPASCFVSTQSTGPHVGDMPAHEILDETAGLLQCYETPCHQAFQVPPLLMASQNSWQAAQDGQGIRDYIAQLEREVLEKPQENVADEPASLVDLDSVDVIDDLGPARRHQPQTQLGTQLPSQMSATPIRHSTSGASRRGLIQSWKFDDTEEEERKFMSSFWRPNRQTS